jgi:hypothetical protein
MAIIRGTSPCHKKKDQNLFFCDFCGAFIKSSCCSDVVLEHCDICMKMYCENCGGHISLGGARMSFRCQDHLVSHDLPVID